MAELRLPDPPLSDGVVALRAFTLDDVTWVVEGCNDPAVARFTGVPAPYTEAHARDWIGPWGRGREAAPRAVRLLAAHAFQALGLQRIEIVPYADNPASQRVAEKAGATREGVLRSYFVARGTRHDCVMYSLLPGDPSPGGEAP